MNNFTFGGAKKIFLGVPRRAEWTDLKKIEKKPYTERWYQPTANISAF